MLFLWYGNSFSLWPRSLTKSIICVSDWLNKGMSPVNSKAKHLDFFSSLPPLSSIPHRTQTWKQQAVFLPQGHCYKMWNSPFFHLTRFPVKKAILECDIQDRLKHRSVFSLIAWLALDPLFSQAMIGLCFVSAGAIWKGNLVPLPSLHAERLNDTTSTIKLVQKCDESVTMFTSLSEIGNPSACVQKIVSINVKYSSFVVWR